MTQPAKPRLHFVAWSPQFQRAFRGWTPQHARDLAAVYLSGKGYGEKPDWNVAEVYGWRVTEVSE